MGDSIGFLTGGLEIMGSESSKEPSSGEEDSKNSQRLAGGGLQTGDGTDSHEADGEARQGAD